MKSLQGFSLFYSDSLLYFKAKQKGTLFDSWKTHVSKTYSVCDYEIKCLEVS